MNREGLVGAIGAVVLLAAAATALVLDDPAPVRGAPRSPVPPAFPFVLDGCARVVALAVVPAERATAARGLAFRNGAGRPEAAAGALPGTFETAAGTIARDVLGERGPAIRRVRGGRGDARHHRRRVGAG